MNPGLPSTEPGVRRRQWCTGVGAWLAAAGLPASAQASHPDLRWYRLAEAMRQRAIDTGDQAYGAVLVTADGIAAEGPSRVVQDGDPDAHAERVAIRAAQRRLGRQELPGAVLYSTARPCAACERAAAQAQVARMYVGAALVDVGRPGD